MGWDTRQEKAIQRCCHVETHAAIFVFPPGSAHSAPAHTPTLSQNGSPGTGTSAGFQDGQGEPAWGLVSLSTTLSVGTMHDKAHGT